MKQRVLFCATVDIHFKKFHLPYLKWFKEKGYEVHVAANGNTLLPYVDQKFNIAIARSPLNRKNWQAYKELHAIIEHNQYQLIHCHTPMGGVLARIAARNVRKQGTKILYTAHGFHFCKGAPLLNWLLYYPIEKGMARWTDCLITINEEDTNRAIQNHFMAGKIVHVHGVGVDTEQFTPIAPIQKHRLRELLGYQPGDFFMFYAAEFNKNKNQQLLIETLAMVKEQMSDAKLLLAGDGPLLDSCKTLAIERDVHHMVEFLGYQEDIKPYLQMSDLAVGSSLREGLPVNIMEAMSCGLPILATQNRGHGELIENGRNGFIVVPGDPQVFASRLLQFYHQHDLRKRMGEMSRERMDRFSLKQVSEEMKKIYMEYITTPDDLLNRDHQVFL